ncbi:3-ketoacyl-(acyl-carrier) reductase [Rhizoctonia solani 123E]|uniref:3-ketoacyl-(Acyl-carrier) reductase n=1 Tax=Rhizoctonia solani 123E TaxID=1423351 RepID=A0A074RR71_9AGAM|nr:3-ketoacyl-(acyl-carrier) reductase [Rhizoctonia solani 123E]
MPTEFDFLISRGDSNYASFARLMEKLMVFRISGIHIRWDIVAHSTRLVELWIEKVAIGYDNAVVPFVRALSSAPNLRDLKIISVSTFCDLDATDERNSLAPIAFPNLESLFLQDLYFNTLEHLLPAIFPSSYRLTLFLTRKSLTRGAPEDEEEDFEPQFVDIHELGSVLALAQTRVDTLMLSGVLDDCWLTGPELRALLLSIPTVKTLKLHNWDLERTVWRALRRSPASRSHPEHHQFPALENLHFYCAKILNQRGLKNMMTSHPIQRMVLGAVCLDVKGGLSEWLCDEDDNIITWLNAKIPALHLVDSTYQPPEFYSHVWRLWVINRGTGRPPISICMGTSLRRPIQESPTCTNFHSRSCVKACQCTMTRVAIVTGAAQGIGRAIALQLARDGIDVAVNDISSKQADLERLVKEIEQLHRKAIATPADVSKETEVQAMVQKAVNELGGLDIVSLIITMTDEAFDKVMGVNCKGTLYCYRAAAVQMIKQGRGGRIIGASSSAGITGNALSGAYSISKFAIRAITQTAALEWGEHNITVNAYAPGVIDTPLSKGNRELRTLPLTKIINLLTISSRASACIKRHGQPEEVAALVAFLASESASYITGKLLF